MLLLNTVTWSICRRTSRSTMNVKTNFAICNLSTWKRELNQRLQGRPQSLARNVRRKLRTVGDFLWASTYHDAEADSVVRRKLRKVGDFLWASTYHDAEAYSFAYYDTGNNMIPTRTNIHVRATHTLSIICNIQIDTCNVDNGYFTSTCWNNRLC